MWTVPVEPKSPELLASAVGDDRVARLYRAVEKFGQERRLININSTATGGGVAEMLRPQTAYLKGADLNTDWLVLEASDPYFFAVTKRLHNKLHGAAGDGGPLGTYEREVFESVMRENYDHITENVRNGDAVVAHDPQTLSLLGSLRHARNLVWRSHIGIDTGNGHSVEAWGFLRKYLKHADNVVFSREPYARSASLPPGVAVRISTPSIDPTSHKNRELDSAQEYAYLKQAGLQDGRPAGKGGDIVCTKLPEPYARWIVQVSRWDRLKDMIGLMTAFNYVAPTDARLVLVGPATEGVTDDPEGRNAYLETLDAWDRLAPAVKDKVTLVSLSMEDNDINALMVNAIQRQANIIVQKSLVEGFGLTVTEAMWKAKPVLASAVGGIRDQITDGHNGLLLMDPQNHQSTAYLLNLLLRDGWWARTLGVNAKQTVLSKFLVDDHLVRKLELLK